MFTVKQLVKWAKDHEVDPYREIAVKLQGTDHDDDEQFAIGFGRLNGGMCIYIQTFEFNQDFMLRQQMP